MSLLCSEPSCDKHFSQSKSQTPYNTLKGPLGSEPCDCLALPHLSPSPLLLQPHWPPYCIFNKPAVFLPQDFCTGCSHCMECFYLRYLYGLFLLPSGLCSNATPLEEPSWTTRLKISGLCTITAELNSSDRDCMDPKT